MLMTGCPSTPTGDCMVAPDKKPDEASPHQGPSIQHTLFLAVTWFIKGLLRAGIPMGPMILLTVRGRKSGKARTTRVDLFERGGRGFLVSTHRQESSNWVRNLRAAGEGVLTRGWSRRAITAEFAESSLKQVVVRAAAADIEDACQWYESQRPIGV